MGHPKGLLQYRGQSLLEHGVEQLQSVCEQVFVVLGGTTGRLEAEVPTHATAVYALKSRWGMRASLRAGLLNIPPGHVLLNHIDRPDIDEDTLTLLTSGHINGPRIPMYRGQTGHPVLIPNWLRYRLLETDGMTLRDIFRKSPLERIETGDPGVVRNLNTRVEWQRFLARA